jgi:hypothetical protein
VIVSVLNSVYAIDNCNSAPSPTCASSEYRCFSNELLGFSYFICLRSNYLKLYLLN